MSFTFGIVEGMYDTGHWDWLVREEYVRFCKKTNQEFYIYAPKNDPHLRDKWHENWPEEDFCSLKRLSCEFRKTDTLFGVGLTPYGVKKLDAKVKGQLLNKVKLINEINPDILCILFDDFINNEASVARVQVDIAHYIASVSTAKKFIIVGTWYSLDPLLERVYGKMPKNYQEDLGCFLDPKISIFWTGDNVISLGYDDESLERISEKFRRKPFLWDNYPVNDPAWLQKRLRIYALTGRPWELKKWTEGHAVNPMQQPWLSMIPIGTLSQLYSEESKYQPSKAFRKSLFSLCSRELADAIESNLIVFSEQGSDTLFQGEKERIQKQFSLFSKEPDCYYATEVIEWLKASKKDN